MRRGQGNYYLASSDLILEASSGASPVLASIAHSLHSIFIRLMHSESIAFGIDEISLPGHFGDGEFWHGDYAAVDLIG